MERSGVLGAQHLVREGREGALVLIIIGLHTIILGPTQAFSTVFQDTALRPTTDTFLSQPQSNTRGCFAAVHAPSLRSGTSCPRALFVALQLRCVPT